VCHPLEHVLFGGGALGLEFVGHGVVPLFGAILLGLGDLLGLGMEGLVEDIPEVGLVFVHTLNGAVLLPIHTLGAVLEVVLHLGGDGLLEGVARVAIHDSEGGLDVVNDRVAGLVGLKVPVEVLALASADLEDEEAVGDVGLGGEVGGVYPGFCKGVSHRRAVGLVLEGDADAVAD